MKKHSFPIPMILLMLLTLVSAASAEVSPLTVTDGKIDNWGFRPFGDGGADHIMGNWTNGSPPNNTGWGAIDAGEYEDADGRYTAWVEGNNASPINYNPPPLPPTYVPAPGSVEGEIFDIELLAWRLLDPDNMQVLVISSIDPNLGTYYNNYDLLYHLGDVFIDTDKDGTYDRALTTGKWSASFPDPRATNIIPGAISTQPDISTLGTLGYPKFYGHTMDIGMYSITAVHDIVRENYLGFFENTAISGLTYPFALADGVAIPNSNVIYDEPALYHYGTTVPGQDPDELGFNENWTSILQWTFPVSALGLTPDPATGRITRQQLKNMKWHLTSECGNDLLELDGTLLPPEPAPPGKIGGTVYFDENADQNMNNVDVGLPTVTVLLKNTLPNGTEYVREEVTGAEGSYLFEDLPPGEYRVEIDEVKSGVILAGLVQLEKPTNPINITAGWITDVDFGYVIQSTIKGTVYNDGDNNKNQDAGEPGIASVMVKLYSVRQGNPVDLCVGIVTTGSDGVYTFEHLPLGQYYVELSNVPTGYVATEIPLNTIKTNPYSLNVNETKENVNFGFYLPPSKITGTVYWDKNGDGDQDVDTEPGINGVSVKLHLSINNIPMCLTVPTHDGGLYSFENLSEGTFKVEVSMPAYITATEVPINNPFTLVPGESRSDVDFGYYFSLLSISGVAYIDANGNKKLDADEPRLPNVTVNLKNELGNQMATTRTGADGSYKFEGLWPNIAPGYRVEILAQTAEADFNEILAATFTRVEPAAPGWYDIVLGFTDSTYNNFGYRFCRLPCHLPGCGRTIGFWKHQCTVALGCKGNAQVSKKALAILLQEVEKLYLVVPFQLGSNKFLTALNIMSNNSCVAVDLLKKQLLATELNHVAGFGLKGPYNKELQGVLIAWGEYLVQYHTSFTREQLLAAKDIFDRINNLGE